MLAESRVSHDNVATRGARSREKAGRVTVVAEQSRTADRNAQAEGAARVLAEKAQGQRVCRRRA